MRSTHFADRITETNLLSDFTLGLHTQRVSQLPNGTLTTYFE